MMMDITFMDVLKAFWNTLSPVIILLAIGLVVAIVDFVKQGNK